MSTSFSGLSVEHIFVFGLASSSLSHNDLFSTPRLSLALHQTSILLGGWIVNIFWASHHTASATKHTPTEAKQCQCDDNDHSQNADFSATPCQWWYSITTCFFFHSTFPFWRESPILSSFISAWVDQCVFLRLKYYYVSLFSVAFRIRLSDLRLQARDYGDGLWVSDAMELRIAEVDFRSSSCVCVWIYKIRDLLRLLYLHCFLSQYSSCVLLDRLKARWRLQLTCSRRSSYSSPSSPVLWLKMAVYWVG